MIPVLPTSRGWVMICASAGSVGVALVNVGFSTALTAAAFTAFLLSSFVLAMISLFRIEVKRCPNQDGVRASRVNLPLLIINKSIRYRQAVVIRERLPFARGGRADFVADPLAPRQQMMLNREIFALKRGFYKLNKLILLGGDPAGLFCRRRIFRLPAEIMIYPESEVISFLPLTKKKRGLPATDGRLLGTSGYGRELFGIREYRHHDEVRFIHWKASARRGKLMVKEFEANTIDSIFILLDVNKRFVGADKYDSNFEYLVKAANSMVGYLSEFYCRLTFVAAGEGGSIRLQGMSSGIKRQVLDTLSNITPQPDASLTKVLDEEMDRLPPNSILYCLSMTEPEGLQSRLDMLAETGVQIRWIFAPKNCFPVYYPGYPRIIRKRRRAKESVQAVQPREVNYNTNLSGLLRHE